MEARSPGRRSNVENAPRRRPVTGQPATPAERSHYVVISRDGRKLVTRVRVVLAASTTPPSYIPGPCSSVGVRPRTDTQSYRRA